MRDSGFNIHSGKFGVFALSPGDCDDAVFAMKASFILDGVVVCISSHHTFFDGRGAFNIIEVFASYCEGQRKSLDGDGLHDRLALLHTVKPQESKGESHEFAADNNAVEVEPADSNRTFAARMEHETQKTMVPIIFSISDQNARDLRENLDYGPIVPSRLDAITAVLFARIIRARAPDLDKDTLCSLNTAVDIRSKLVPPLPNGYLGNAVFGACLLDRPLIDFLARGHAAVMRHIAGLTQQLRREILRIDDVIIREYIDILNRCPDADHSRPERNSVYMFVSSWAAWPACELDFGSVLGLPDAVRVFTGDGGGVRVQPRKGRDGDYEVTALLEKQAVDRLRGDGVLGRWFEIRFLE